MKDGATTKRAKIVVEIAVMMLKGTVSGSIAYLIHVTIPQSIFLVITQALPPALVGVAVRENSYLLAMGILIFLIAFVGAVMFRTVIQGVCTVAVTVTSIVFLIALTNGGIMVLNLPSIAWRGIVITSATLTIDFRTLLAACIMVSSINILRGMLESTSVLLERQNEAEPVF